MYNYIQSYVDKDFAEVTMRRLIAAAAFALFAFVLLPEASPDLFGPKEIGPTIDRPSRAEGF